MTNTVGSSTSVAPSTHLNNYSVTLDQLMMKIQSERADILDKSVRDAAKEIQDKNNLLQEANKFLNAARIKQGEAESNDSSTMDADMKAFFEKNGIKWDNTGNDDIHNKDEWKINIENMKTFIDSLTSTSQLDMTRLQSVMGKYNQTFEQLSNFLSKYQSSLDSLTSNQR